MSTYLSDFYVPLSQSLEEYLDTFQTRSWVKADTINSPQYLFFPSSTARVPLLVLDISALQNNYFLALFANQVWTCKEILSKLECHTPDLGLFPSK